MEIKKNDIFTVDITDINNLGNGVARLDGKVVFVKGAVIGDRARVKIIKVTGDYLVARVEAIEEASVHRRAPDCPVAGSCGGCVYSNITLDCENALKKSYVENVFKKARVEGIVVEEPICTEEEGYRCKVEYPFDKDGHIGLYERSSHRVIPCATCLRQSRALDELCLFVDEFFSSAVSRGVYTVYNEESGKGLLRHVYIRYAKGTDTALLMIVINGDSLKGGDAFANAIAERFPFVKSVAVNINKKKTNVILGEKCVTLYGDDAIYDIICGEKFKFSPLSFCQVNHTGMELLYKKAAELADIKPGDKVTDLYCGVGTIGISLLSLSGCKDSAELVGVEIIPDAVKNAKENASLADVQNARFYCGDADASEVESSDIVIVDPPRKGCGASLIERIAKIAPKRVVYISCNPDTLARDVKEFEKYGYFAKIVYPVNMFVGTGHVETIVCLNKQ